MSHCATYSESAESETSPAGHTTFTKGGKQGREKEKTTTADDVDRGQDETGGSLSLGTPSTMGTFLRDWVEHIQARFL